MSFAAQTKKELTLVDNQDACCERAELSALIRMNGSVHLASRKIILDISTENAAIARRIYSLIKKIFDVHTELLVRKKMRLKKNNVYIVRIPAKVQEILKDLNIVSEGFMFNQGIDKDMIKRPCCKRAYLRGAFLAGGSVNNPEGSSYHLEISCMYEEHCGALVALANKFGLNARCIERKKGFIFYIKEGEKIIELLNIIGAHQALFKFEDVRIMRDMRNSVNRIVNCETANLNKTIGGCAPDRQHPSAAEGNGAGEPAREAPRGGGDPASASRHEPQGSRRDAEGLRQQVRREPQASQDRRAGRKIAWKLNF